MKISITPRVRSFHNGQQIEYCIDRNWSIFLNAVFPESTLCVQYPETILHHDSDLVIISGGNNISSVSNKHEDSISNQFNRSFLISAIQKNITVIGICYGAQLVAEFFNSELIRSTTHVGTHEIAKNNQCNFLNGINVESKTNSYHDYCITTLGNGLEPILYANDNTVEMFRQTDSKLYGIMWHPERFHKHRPFDIAIFKKIFAESLRSKQNNSTLSSA